SPARAGAPSAQSQARTVSERPAASHAPEPAAGIDGVDDHIARLEADGFAGALLVVRGGDAVVRTGLGLAHRGTATPNTAGTAFDIGSIAKTFTAAAVLRLVDDGALALDDTLGDLLPHVPADKRGITVRQLLDFTSGLGEYHDTEGDFEVMSRREALRRILGQELRFAPGTDSAYSNSSYTLAAIIVERVTGRAFTAVVRNLFATAGLDHTGFYGSADLRGMPVATGYRGDRHGRNDPASWEPTWALLGAGGIASTVDDLQRWWELLQAPGLLRPGSSQVLAAALPAQPLDGMQVRGVGGTNDFGFDASLIEIVGQDTVIVVLSNVNPPDRTIASDTSVELAKLVGR
ncbi:MAG TPA: serine hydrolase domain-containing protein, partial [Euzebyales bacterium]|nr:serine hydrolase domain-containing protein [Euzebyales bacterium]